MKKPFEGVARVFDKKVQRGNEGKDDVSRFLTALIPYNNRKFCLNFAAMLSYSFIGYLYKSFEYTKRKTIVQSKCKGFVPLVRIVAVG
jgi:hypothetical protein